MHRCDCYALFSCFGFRSKNGFLEDALTGIAITILQSFSQFRRCAANPAENMTRVSTRKSAPWRTSGTCCDTYIYAVQCAGNSISTSGTGGKSAMAAVQALCLLACSYQYNTFGT